MTAQRNITDRGLRYRAQNNMPDHARVCVFCGRPWETQTGARPVLEVGHLDGNESHDTPDNLSWTCRACNVAAGASLRSAGRGRLTRQFNPTKSGGARSLGEWVNAVSAITPHIDRGDRGLGESTMSVPDAVAMIRATPHSKRSDFSSQLRAKGAGVRGGKGRYNPGKKENLFGFGRTLSPRQTTPARGGIAAHMAEPKKEKAATAGTYRSYTIHKTGDGEFYSSLEPGSWFATPAGVKKHIDWYLKTRGNPASTKSKGHLFFLDGFEWYKAGNEVYRAPLNAAFENGYRMGRWEFPEWQISQRKKAGVYPFGKNNPSAFDRCVGSVESRGGARDPRAVCAAAGRAKYGQAEMTRRAVAGKRKAARGNPASAADEVFEEFHGYAPNETVHVVATRHHHRHLAAAGELRKLEVLGIDGKRHTITGFGDALFTFNESKNQLFVTGGDQSINIEDFGITEPHEIETLGQVEKIDYFTNKEHLGDEGGEAVYTHKLRTTNENGKHVTVKIARYPDLIYRVREQSLEFSGGSYVIRAEGIDK